MPQVPSNKTRHCCQACSCASKTPAPWTHLINSFSYSPPAESFSFFCFHPFHPIFPPISGFKWIRPEFELVNDLLILDGGKCNSPGVNDSIGYFHIRDSLIPFYEQTVESKIPA